MAGLDVGSAFATFSIKLDGVKQASKQAASSMSNIEKSAKRTQSSLDKSMSGVNSKMANVTQKMEGLSNKSKKLGASGAIAAVGFGAGIKKIITAGVNFDKAMSSVQAKTGATAEEFGMLSGKARELGETTIFSASEVANAMDFMAMAGMETSQIMEGVKDTLDLATAGNIELAQSSDIATNVMSIFGIEAKNLNRVVDVMAKTVTSSNTNISEMGEALKYIGPTMQALNVPLEETSAIIAALADRGIKGSLAGRALGTSIVRLSKPTSMMSEKMQDLGLKFFDANGEFIGMNNMVGHLNEKMAKLTDEQRQNALSTLFGMEAMQELNIILDVGQKNLQDYTQGLINSSGAGAEMARIMADNQWGAFRALASAAESLSITLNDSLEPVVNKIVEKLTLAVRSTNEWAQKNQNLSKIIIVALGSLIAMTLAIAALGLILFPVVKGVDLVIAALKFLKINFIIIKTVTLAWRATLLVLRSTLFLVRGALLIVRATMLFMLSPVGLVVLAIAVLIAIGYLLIKNMIAQKDNVIKSWGIIKNWISKKAYEAKSKALSAMYSLKSGFYNIVANIQEKVSSTFSRMRDGMRNSVDSAKNAVISTLSSMSSKMYSIGKSILEGLWNGMQSMMGWISKKVSNFVSDLVSKFKKALDINSPSRVMAEIGGYMTEGIAVGMQANMGDIDYATERVGERAINITNNNNMSSGLDVNSISQRMAWDLKNAI